MTMETQLDVGDIVYLGPPNDRKVHWRIEHIHSRIDPLGVYLRSGMTDRVRYANYVDLRLHSKGVPA